jgi:phosphate transport system substrate-binding protein
MRVRRLMDKQVRCSVHLSRVLCMAILVGVSGHSLFAQEDVAGSEVYTPRKVSPPKDAPYLLPDGSIYIAGNDLAAPLLEKFNALFVKLHPGFKFKMDATSSGESIAGFMSGKSAFAASARDVTFVDKEAFVSLYGYPVTDLLIGWDNTPDSDHFPPGKFPPGVWVNIKNPVAALSMEQLAAILLTGSPKGDITKWGQIQFDEAPVGNNGADYAKREIHIYMPTLRGLPVLSTGRTRLGNGLPWSTRVEYLPMVEDVLNAVANDPFGIGLVGWFPIDEGWDRSSELSSKVRLLPLQKDADARISRGGPGDLYPLAGGVHLLMNWAPGKPKEPWLEEYARMVFSKQGRDIISSTTLTDGFMPLESDDLATELAKLK